MGLQANIGEKVQANFKALLQRPETTEQLKAILNETIKANQSKTKEQIIAIFEERKKQFALQLQKQAVDSARSSVLPGLRKTAVEELIEERLKLQEAKRVNVVASDDDVEKLIKSIAERNKLTVDQFAKNMASMGGDIGAMRARFKATLSWNDVIRRKFGHQIAITERDIDRAVSAAPGGPGEDQVDINVQRITVPLGGAKIDQKNVAQRLQEAEAARTKFNGCKSTATVANALAGAKFEDLGARKPSTIPEPTRSMLLSAKDGEMLPASVGQGGVELWAVCSRTVVKADEAKREAVQGDLRQKEFEILAKKHLKDLRQDASIEWR
jgi:peptidyl-prolyl cis-trans isomerase SurA